MSGSDSENLGYGVLGCDNVVAAESGSKLHVFGVSTYSADS